MRLQVTDLLKIQWGDEVVKARPYKEYRKVNRGDRVKVIFSGDITESPVTINTKNILEVIKFHESVGFGV